MNESNTFSVKKVVIDCAVCGKQTELGSFDVYPGLRLGQDHICQACFARAIIWAGRQALMSRAKEVTQCE